MSATIAPADPPTLLEQLTAQLKSDAMGPSRLEQLRSVHTFISTELATIAETHSTETPTFTTLVRSRHSLRIVLTLTLTDEDHY